MTNRHPRPSTDPHTVVFSHVAEAPVTPTDRADQPVPPPVFGDAGR